MTAEAEVDDFRPSRHGLHFVNRWDSGRVQRLFGGEGPSMGLCGGMAFVVRDLFDRGVEPPLDTVPPEKGTRRYDALFRRQVESFDWLRLPVRFWLLTLQSRSARARGVVEREWPRIRAEIDAGRLAQLGVLRETSSNPFRLTRNHQVLAYGYRAEPDALVVRVYDPNWPDRDDVEIRAEAIATDAPRFRQSTGEPVHAFFLARYVPAEPRAWRKPS